MDWNFTSPLNECTVPSSKRRLKYTNPRMPRSRSILSATLFCLLVSNAGAQQQDTTKFYEGKPVKVVADRYARVATMSEIAARMPIALHKIPASVAVVTQRVLREQNATVLSRALRNIGSANVQSGLGTHDYFLIRGFESTSAGLVLTDGAREPDLSFFRFYGFGFYDLYNVDHVEVLKGPAAFLYGSNTHSGTVNLVRKQPVFSNFAELTMTYGRFGSYRQTFDIASGGSNSKYAYRLNGVWQALGKFRSHSQVRNYAINPAFTWNLDKRSSITANLEYCHSDIRPDVGIPLYIPEESWLQPDVPATTSYQSAFDKLDYDVFRLRLDYRRDLRKWAQLRNKLHLTYSDSDSRFTMIHVPYRTATGTWIMDRHMYSFDEMQPFIGNQLELLLTLWTGAAKHNLLLGFETARLANSASHWTSELNTVLLFAPANSVYSFDELVTFQIKIDTDARRLVAAPYVVDYISFSERFQLFCGGRLDYIDFYTDRQNAPFDYEGRSLSSNPAPFSQKYLKFSPMLGVVVQDSENLWFYANAGRSFGQGTRLIDEPEESTQFEFGYKYRTAGDKIITSAAIYHLQKDNVSIPLQGPLQGGAHESIGSQRSRGLEFGLTAQPFTGWYFSLAYSYTQAELMKYTALTISPEVKLTLEDFTGNHPAFVPAQIANLWLTKQLGNGLVFGLGFRYVGTQFVSLDNDFSIGDHYTYDALLSYEFQNCRFRLNVENFTKVRFLSRGLGPYSVIPTDTFGVYGSIDILTM